MPRLIQRLQPTHEDIARLAYKLWEESGKPGDRDAEFWLKAEQLLCSATLPVRQTLVASQTAEPHPAVSFAPAIVAPSGNKPKIPGRRWRRAAGANA